MKLALTRVMSGAVLCVLAMLWTSPPALAKGPAQGVMTGPGIASPIRLRVPGTTTIGVDLAKVVEQSGFFSGAWDDDDRRRLDARPAGELGPRYTITYTMSPGKIVQYVYPYAEPRPITHMPAGQSFWGSNETVGAWYVAPIALRRTLVALGLPAEASPPLAAGHEPAPVVASSATGSNAAPIVVVLAGLALALVVIVGTKRRGNFVIRRPDRRSLAPPPQTPVG
ncbi:MAG TPA: hypothetical protein VH989_13015 [Actinomycetota bacterium]|jgi:hypothetical protein